MDDCTEFYLDQARAEVMEDRHTEWWEALEQMTEEERHDAEEAGRW